MDIKKLLDMVGIIPIRSLNFEEINFIAKSFAELLLDTFPELKLNYAQICKKMFQCNMYIAKFKSNLGNANYVHKNNTIYIREGIENNKTDKYVLHECIHYFQDTRGEKGELKKIGLCDFTEFKVNGLALNEAAVQYVVCKMLGKQTEQLEYNGLTLKTNSKDYLPIINDLIIKLLYFFKERDLTESVLFSTDKFKINIIEYCGEEAFKNIQNNFDVILELEQKITDDNKDKLEQKIKKIYIDTQTTIYTSYFGNVYYMLETIEEVEEYREKLISFEKELVDEVKEEYKKYIEKQLEKIDKKIIQISRSNARNTLAVISNHKIFEIFRMIKRIFVRQ